MFVQNCILNFIKREGRAFRKLYRAKQSDCATCPSNKGIEWGVDWMDLGSIVLKHYAKARKRWDFKAMPFLSYERSF